MLTPADEKKPVQSNNFFALEQRPAIPPKTLAEADSHLPFYVNAEPPIPEYLKEKSIVCDDFVCFLSFTPLMHPFGGNSYNSHREGRHY